VQSDKNSIIQMAAKKIEEMQRRREELQRRKLEVEANLAAVEGVATIRVRVANPTSGVDSMVEVLKCLKDLGLETRSIRSNFSAHEFSAELEIESQVRSTLLLQVHTIWSGLIIVAFLRIKK
jgi:hypothetical protein